MAQPPSQGKSITKEQSFNDSIGLCNRKTTSMERMMGRVAGDQSTKQFKVMDGVINQS